MMELSRGKTLAFRLALLAAIAAVTHLATTRMNYPVVEDINDKVNHIFAFYVLALLADFSFPKNGFGPTKALTLLGYGLLIEIIQYFLPYRSSSFFDLAADGAGLFVYWISLPALRRAPWLRTRWNFEGKDHA
jgi:VanZ family protein